MTEEADHNLDALIELTAEVVSAYVSNNPVPVGDLPALIGQVHAALKGTAGSVSAEQPQAQACCSDQEVGDGGLHHLP